METVKDIIRRKLESKDRVEVKYICRTTSTNHEDLHVTVGGVEIESGITAYDLGMVERNLACVVEELRGEFPDINIVKRYVELHFRYPGFNSCQTKELPVAVSKVRSTVKKTGIVKESYKMVGKAKVLDIIARYPDYELYERSGFAFRGAQEKTVTMEELVKTLEWMACADVAVVDNEIHVNAFSCSDMW